jgi:hypothetical protein
MRRLPDQPPFSLVAFLRACVDAIDNSQSQALQVWDAIYSGPTDLPPAAQLAGALEVSQWFLLQLRAATGRSAADLLSELNAFLLHDDL